jgi:hypothetical protein
MRKRTLSVVLLSAVMLSAGFAGESIGEIVYVEGTVDLTRNGSRVAGEPDFGSRVENYDLIAAGKDGLAEVSIDPATGIDALIKVSRNSSFYFELSSMGGGRRKAGVELLAGSVALSVKKLAGTAVEVRTANAVMGVRGTEFVVTTAPGGELLVACSTGLVECRDTENNVLLAEPGHVVEQIPGASFRRIPVTVSSLEEFTRNWMTERIEVFKGQALRAIESYGTRYARYSGEFRTRYTRLMDHWNVISKWMAEDKAGTVGGTMEVMREKRALIGPMLDIRGTLFMFERIYYRLLELKEYYDQGYGRGVMSNGQNSSAVFRQLERERALLDSQMSMVRYITKLYAARNGGDVPGGLMDGEGDGASSDGFFGGSDSFFDSGDDFF